MKHCIHVTDVFSIPHVHHYSANWAVSVSISAVLSGTIAGVMGYGAHYSQPDH